MYWRAEYSEFTTHQSHIFHRYAGSIHPRLLDRVHRFLSELSARDELETAEEIVEMHRTRSYDARFMAIDTLEANIQRICTEMYTDIDGVRVFNIMCDASCITRSLKKFAATVQMLQLGRLCIDPRQMYFLPTDVFEIIWSKHKMI